MTKRGTDLPFALPATTPAARARARRIDDALANAHPDAHCELNWGQPHELLFATILSAQCTDVAVNRATESLFSAFPTVENFAQASPEMIGKHIKTIGLHRNKAKFLHGSRSSKNGQCCLGKRFWIKRWCRGRYSRFSTLDSIRIDNRQHATGHRKGLDGPLSSGEMVHAEPSHDFPRTKSVQSPSRSLPRRSSMSAVLQ